MCLKNITRVHSILYLIKQTTIGLVGFSIFHHSMQNAKCQSRGLARGCNGAKVKGEKWNIFGKSGAKKSKTRDQKTPPHLRTKQLHTLILRIGNKLHKNLKRGIK